LYGLDLFNHGYYWEAHEIWERIWHACGRAGPAGNFIKGLIKLAAAGVKAREGRPEGVRTHARRAAELFRQTVGQLPPGQTCYFGLSLQRLIGLATDVARGPIASNAPAGAPVEVVFQFVLQPDETVNAVDHDASDVVTPLISAGELAQRVQELALQISGDYVGKQPLVVGVLKGAWIFMADLVRHLTVSVSCDFVMLSSYGAGTSSSGQIELRLDLALPAAARDILLIDDIVDTGASLAWLIEHLASKKPESLRVCALLDKPARRRVPVNIDYVGFTVPNYFVVGYGIDCRERYRELPYVGYVRMGDASNGS
jgi:hypoxanthine phosphoribosyltransferase